MIPYLLLSTPFNYDTISISLKNSYKKLLSSVATSKQLSQNHAAYEWRNHAAYEWRNQQAWLNDLLTYNFSSFRVKSS